MTLTSQPELQQEKGGYTLRGDITMFTAHLLPTSLECTDKDECLVDLSAIGRSDSSAVGVFLSWIKNARKNSGIIRFGNVPDNLLSLIHLYGVDSLIKQS